MGVLIAFTFVVLGILSFAGRWPSRTTAGQSDHRNQRRLGLILVTIGIILFALVLNYPRSP